MKNKAKKIIIIAGITLLVSGIAWGFGHSQKTVHPLVVKSVKAIKPEPVPVYDQALLKKFITGIRSLDFNRERCTYSGVIDMVDPNDTTNTVHNLHFLFCRSGGDYYYRIGGAEIVHENNANLYIQNEQHKVVISQQQVAIQQPVKNLDVIIKALQSENYALKASKKGDKQTLSILNENSLSCKELSVTLDTLTGKPEQIFTRLNDFGNIKDKGKDRTIDVRINEMSGHANLALYPTVSSIVRQENSRLLLTGKYKNYELIRL